MEPEGIVNGSTTKPRRRRAASSATATMTTHSRMTRLRDWDLGAVGSPESTAELSSSVGSTGGGRVTTQTDGKGRDDGRQHQAEEGLEAHRAVPPYDCP